MNFLAIIKTNSIFWSLILQNPVHTDDPSILEALNAGTYKMLLRVTKLLFLNSIYPYQLLIN